MGRRKCAKVIIESPCEVAEHTSYICSVILKGEPENGIHFICPECKFEGISDKIIEESLTKPRVLSIQEFLEFLFETHSSKTICNKVFPNSNTLFSIERTLGDCLQELEQEKSALEVFLESFFNSLHRECMKLLEESLSILRNETSKRLLESFEANTDLFKRIEELLLYKKVICRQISQKKPENLKQYFTSFILGQREMNKSQNLLLFHYQSSIQQFEAVLASGKPLSAFLPKFSKDLGSKVTEESQELVRKLMNSIEEMQEKVEVVSGKWIQFPNFEELHGFSKASETRDREPNEEELQNLENFPTGNINGSFGSILNFTETLKLKEEMEMKKAGLVSLEISDENDLRHLYHGMQLATMKLRPSSNTDAFWEKVRKETEKLGVQIKHLFVNGSGSAFSLSQAEELRSIIGRQDHLKTLAINFKK